MENVFPTDFFTSKADRNNIAFCFPARKMAIYPCGYSGIAIAIQDSEDQVLTVVDVDDIDRVIQLLINAKITAVNEMAESDAQHGAKY